MQQVVAAAFGRLTNGARSCPRIRKGSGLEDSLVAKSIRLFGLVAIFFGMVILGMHSNAIAQDLLPGGVTCFQHATVRERTVVFTYLEGVTETPPMTKDYQCFSDPQDVAFVKNASREQGLQIIETSVKATWRHGDNATLLMPGNYCIGLVGLSDRDDRGYWKDFFKSDPTGTMPSALIVKAFAIGIKMEPTAECYPSKQENGWVRPVMEDSDRYEKYRIIEIGW